MKIPAPPFHYFDTECLLFVPDNPLSSVRLWGLFPQAPTGPFTECWYLGHPTEEQHDIQRIYVDNEVRCRAGRSIWGMPKFMARIDLRLRQSGATLQYSQVDRVTTETLEWVVPQRGLPHASPFALRLSLPGGRATALKFEFADAPLRAVLGAGGFSERGTLTRLGGDAVLAAPSPIDEALAAVV